MLTLSVLITFFSACTSKQAEKEKTLKDALEGKFYVGAALNERQITGTDSLSIDILKKHFNSIVAENCMKSERIHPEEGKFNWDLPERKKQHAHRGAHTHLAFTGSPVVFC